MNYPATWQDEILRSNDESERAPILICAEKTDQQLTELVLAGEESAFELIFNRYKRLVGAVAGYYFQRPEQIEEIIQISFAKVYFELKNFRGEHDFSMAKWIGRITANVCLDQLRSQKRTPESSIYELTEQESERLFAEFQKSKKTAENQLVDRDLVEKLLSSLSIEDRVILQMFYAEDLSVGEMSELTGWSSSKIKIRAFRARSALRKILKRFV